MVSIIIPCYNNGSYLLEMIDCFRNQTSSDWEMIIVDDGSTDDTPNVIKEYIVDFPNVHFYHREREPKGSVVCRNIGFEHSKGEYICHLDADDLVSNTFVEHRQAFMEEHPDVDYASFPAKSFSDVNALPTYETETNTWGVGDETIDLLEKFLRVEYPFSVWNNIYKREALKNLPWDENVKIYTDFSFIVPGILGGLRHKFSGLKEIDYFYRQVQSNKVAMTSDFISQEKCNSTIYLFSKTLDAISDHHDAGKYRKDFFNFILLHFTRLLMSSDNREKMETFIQMCSKHYRCERRLRFVGKLSSIRPQYRYRLMCIEYVFLFGNTHYLKTYLNLINKKA